MDDCRVWAFGVADTANPDRVAVAAGDVYDFLYGIFRECPSIVYFHNLKFDGAFILDAILRLGFTPATEERIYPGEFDMLMSDLGSLYTITVGSPYGPIEFRDSLKKLPFTLAKVGAMYGKVSKGELDHSWTRPVGHTLTAEERDYIRRDVSILAHAVADLHSRGASAITIGSDVLAEFKDVCGGQFPALFPQLGAELARDIRASYRGGWTYAAPRHAGRVRPGGAVYDVNSLYPHVMYTCELPYGLPMEFEGPPPGEGLWIAAVEFEARLRPGAVPVIQTGGGLIMGAKYGEVIEPTTLTVTSVDWELWNEMYEITVFSWFGGWTFESADNLFRPFIDKWMAIKEASSGADREFAKLHLNSLYGKFGTATFGRNSMAYLDAEKDFVRFKSGELEERSGVYVPVACFVTAYARAITARAARDAGGAFVYADTDSLHLTYPPKTTGIGHVRRAGRRWRPANRHQSRLGAWKLEYEPLRMLALRPKAYSEDLPDGAHVTRIAAVPRHITEGIRIDDLLAGGSLEIRGKLVPARCPGGVVLVERVYTLDLSMVR